MLINHRKDFMFTPQFSFLYKNKRENFAQGFLISLIIVKIDQ